jgi:hypothetical protein
MNNGVSPTDEVAEEEMPSYSTDEYDEEEEENKDEGLAEAQEDSVCT